MGLTLSAYDDALKLWYKGPIKNLLKKRRILLEHIRKVTKSTRFHGNEVRCPVHISRNWGIGAREENQPLPTAGNQGHDQAVWHPMNIYARIRLTGPVMDASSDDIGAFADALDTEMIGAAEDARRDLARQVWHDGSGVLTQCAVTTTGSTVVNVSSTKFIKVGQKVDIRTTDGAAAATNGTDLTVSAVSATTITIDASVTTATTHSVYLAGTRGGTGSVKTELWGVEALANNADFANTTHGLTYEPGKISRDSVDAWQCQKVDESGALSLAGMDAAFDAPEEEADGEARIALTSYAAKRAYGALLTGLRRYGGNTMRLKGGYRGLEFNGIAVVPDKDASVTMTPGTFDRMYFLDLNEFTFYVRRDWDWISQGSSALHWVTGYDAFEGALRARMELAVENPRKQCVLYGITNA